MTWTRLALAGIALAAALPGCAPEGAKDARSSGYASELSSEMPKPKEDTPLFDPPPNVLERDGAAKAPSGG